MPDLTTLPERKDATHADPHSPEPKADDTQGGNPFGPFAGTLGDYRTPESREARESEIDTLPSRPGKPNGKVSTLVLGTKEQREYLLDLARRFSGDAYGFLLHLLDSSPRKGEGWVPVGSRLIRSAFGTTLDPAEMESAGLIEVKPYDRYRGKSREYRVVREVRRRFFELGLTSERLHRGGLFNLASKSKTTNGETRKTVKSSTYTPKRNPYAPLIRKSIKSVPLAFFNAGAIERHLAESKRAVDASLAGAGRDRLEARYIGDLRCYHAILTQNAEPLDKNDLSGLWRYKPAYKKQQNGRISQKGGGLQSCSREMKAAAYEGVDGFRNYDLRSSQAVGLVLLLEQAGLDASWFRDYVQDPKAKYKAAEAVGIDVADWKTAWYASMMGARVPTLEQARFSKGDAVEAIRAACAPEEFDAVYERFLAHTEEPRRVLKAWHEWIEEVYVPGNAVLNNLDGKRYLTNTVGAKVAVEDLMVEGKKWKLRSRVAAFLLQGLEAALIHSLSASWERYDFRVLSNEHDGLAVQGEIPEEAVREACKVAGLPPDLVSLDEKPLL